MPLVSAKGVDYRKLRELLATGNWKEADLETNRVMLKVAGRESEGWLRYEDAENFSCQDLGTIDKLWVKYSNGKFGFSVQKQIYQSLDAPGSDNCRLVTCQVPYLFAKDVGWIKGQEQRQGHFPKTFWGRIKNDMEFFSAILSCRNSYTL
ncbi:MAG: GUN4 domain-containing protein [Okeania sp. SIO1H6]|nr:GUN4 domain-containing protein [Okeania sp. SIO1H6]